MNERFQRSSAGKVLLDWRKDLEKNRGSRAKLRRAASPEEVALVPAFHQLVHQMGEGFSDPSSEAFLRLAAVAGLVARAELSEEGKDSIAKQMGPPTSGQPPRVSVHRFRRLLESRGIDDLFSQLRRIIPLLGRKVHLTSLADGVVDWCPEIRRRWAYDYYATVSEERKASRS